MRWMVLALILNLIELGVFVSLSVVEATLRLNGMDIE